MKRIVRLTERDLSRIVRRVINETSNIVEIKQLTKDDVNVSMNFGDELWGDQRYFTVKDGNTILYDFNEQDYNFEEGEEVELQVTVQGFKIKPSGDWVTKASRSFTYQVETDYGDTAEGYYDKPVPYEWGSIRMKFKMPSQENYDIVFSDEAYYPTAVATCSNIKGGKIYVKLKMPLGATVVE